MIINPAIFCPMLSQILWIDARQRRQCSIETEAKPVVGNRFYFGTFTQDAYDARQIDRVLKLRF